MDMRGNLLGRGDLNVYDPMGQPIRFSTNTGITEPSPVSAISTGYYYVLMHSPLQGTDWHTLWVLCDLRTMNKLSHAAMLHRLPKTYLERQMSGTDTPS